MSVRWGLVSTAPINRSIIAAARESERAEVIAVASRDPARGAAYAREHGIERSYDELDGGAMMDVGCYCVNAIWFLAGEPESISGHRAAPRRRGRAGRGPSADSYRLELEDVSGAIRGEAALLLGRSAVGQARTIEALHGAAA